MHCRNKFLKHEEFTISTNLLTHGLTKAFTFMLISTLLTFLIVTIHASDALSLDTSFGGDGKVTTSFSAGNDVGSGIAVQSDDKIVVVGTSDNGSGTSEFAVARYNVDGSLDSSFDNDGKVTTFFSAGDDVGSGIAVQSDGKIVVVGTSDNESGSSELAVARFDVDGSLDVSFSGDGKVTTSFSAGDNIGSGIAIQSDDKIVVVGTSDNGSGPSEFAVARFNINGTLDNSFGSGGKVLTKFSLAGDDVGSGIAVQSDDKIVVVGTSDDLSGNSEFAVARFNLDGSLDPSFSGDGRVTLSFTAGDDVGSGIAVQSDGKIVVVGTTDDLSNTWLAVARFTVNGSLDPSFGAGGTLISISSSNGNDMGSGNAVQSDDRTVVVGSSEDVSGKWRFVVARFNIDASFPSPAIDSGKAITSFSAGDDFGSGIAVQFDDKIVVVGTSDAESGNSEIAVARYLFDLSLNGGDDSGNGGGGGGGGCFIDSAADSWPMQP